jgi:PKD repeat protein
MKKIFILAVFSLLLINSCKKGNDQVLKASDETTTPKPEARFSIANLASEDLILEGNITDFRNESTNGDSYLWDFGNGITSSEMVPHNISFIPCGGKYTISLTVKNKSGETSTYKQQFEILCRGRNAHRAGSIKPIHLNTQQINAAYSIQTHS